MPAPPNPDSSADDRTRQNLFVEPNPGNDALTSPPTESSPAMDTRAARQPGRGRGPVTSVEGQAKSPPPPPWTSPILAIQDGERSRL
jgi:hypothetical protein